MTEPANRFDALAATWDDDPAKVATAQAAAASLRAAVPLERSGWNSLEVGSGTGLLSRALAPDLGAITLVDTSEQMTLVAAERVSAVTEAQVTAWCLDLTVEQPTTGPYDLAYSLLALHHIDDVPGVLGAIHDLLAPRGYLAILDLDHDPGGSFHRLDTRHDRTPRHDHKPGHNHASPDRGVDDTHASAHDHDHDAGHRGAHGDPEATHDSVDHVHDGFTADSLREFLATAGFIEITVDQAGFDVEKGEPTRAYPVLRAVGRRAG